MGARADFERGHIYSWWRDLPLPQGFDISQFSLQFSVHKNSVHAQVITTRINMPNTMMMPQVIAVNKRLSPIKCPLSTILARKILPSLFENRWFTFKDIDETDTRVQFVKVNGKFFGNIISNK